MKLEYLADHQQFIPQLAEWRQTEFSYLNPALTPAISIEKLKTHCNRRNLPNYKFFVNHKIVSSSIVI